MFAYSTAFEWTDGVWLITLQGELSLATYPTIRRIIGKCFSDDPTAIIVDLRGAQGEGKLLLNLLATERRRGERLRIPVVYIAGKALATRINSSAVRHFVDVAATSHEAIEHAKAAPLRPWLHFGLEPDPLSESTARHRIGEACIDWGLPHLLHPARVIVSEFVANAVQHARTAIDVTASIAIGLLRIRVHDRSPQRPMLRAPTTPDQRAPLDVRGQGLHRVATRAKAWGYTPTKDGKIVWATLDTTRVGDLAP